jgi:hypothetical protein
MAITASQEIAREKVIHAWQGFRPGLRQREINVRVNVNVLTFHGG